MSTTVRKEVAKDVRKVSPKVTPKMTINAKQEKIIKRENSK